MHMAFVALLSFDLESLQPVTLFTVYLILCCLALTNVTLDTHRWQHLVNTFWRKTV